MRIRLLSVWDVIPLLMAAGGGVLITIASLLAWDWRPLAFGLGLGAVGILSLRYTYRHASYLIIRPDGFSIPATAGGSTDIAWEQLREVRAVYGGRRGSSVEFVWETQAGAPLSKRQISLGETKAGEVEARLKWYWHHPERRFRLKPQM